MVDDQRYAEKIAEKALDIALKALTKVEAMEKSTQKAYFLPASEVQDMNVPFEPDPEHLRMSQTDMEQKLDELFESYLVNLALRFFESVALVGSGFDNALEIQRARFLVQ